MLKKVAALLKQDPSGTLAVRELERRRLSSAEQDEIFFQAELLAYPHVKLNYPSWLKARRDYVPKKSMTEMSWDRRRLRYV